MGKYFAATRHCALAGALVLGTSTVVQAQQAKGFVYDAGTYTTFKVPGKDVTETETGGINNNGEIVGTFGDAIGVHGFIETGGNFTTIDAPQTIRPGLATYTSVYGVNDNGWITGLTGGGAANFVSMNGIFTELNYPGAVQTLLTGINNSGDILGTALIPFPPQCCFTGSFGIHFLYSNGNFTILDPFGASQSRALGINNLGQIVGDYAIGDSVTGYLYSAGSVMSLSVPGSSSTTAMGINDLGQIVGSFTQKNGVTSGFLYSDGVFTIIAFPNAITQPTGINNAGKVVGTVQFGHPPPGIPEPATWAMLLLGFFGIGSMMRGARRTDPVAIG